MTQEGSRNAVAAALDCATIRRFSEEVTWNFCTTSGTGRYRMPTRDALWRVKPLRIAQTVWRSKLPDSFAEVLTPAAAALLESVRAQGFPGWAFLTVAQARGMMAGFKLL